MITESQVSWQPMSYPTKDLMLFEELNADKIALIDAYGLNVNLFSSERGTTFSNVCQNNLPHLQWPSGFRRLDVRERLDVWERLEHVDGALADILVATQQAFVQDLQPVVGDSAVGFDPELGVVTSGTILRVMGAYVVTYRTEVHNSLVGLSSRAWGGRSTACAPAYGRAGR